MHDYISSALYNVLHGYVDAACQKLMMEHLGDGLESLRRLKQQCAIITFADKQRFDQIFKQCSHRTGETANGYMKRFHAAKSLATSVDNLYTEQQLMHLFLDNFHNPGNKYSAQVAQH